MILFWTLTPIPRLWMWRLLNDFCIKIDHAQSISNAYVVFVGRIQSTSVWTAALAQSYPQQRYSRYTRRCVSCARPHSRTPFDSFSYWRQTSVSRKIFSSLHLKGQSFGFLLRIKTFSFCSTFCPSNQYLIWKTRVLFQRNGLSVIALDSRHHWRTSQNLTPVVRFERIRQKCVTLRQTFALMSYGSVCIQDIVFVAVVVIRCQPFRKRSDFIFIFSSDSEFSQQSVHWILWRKDVKQMFVFFKLLNVFYIRSKK